MRPTSPSSRTVRTHRRLRTLLACGMLLAVLLTQVAPGRALAADLVVLDPQSSTRVLTAEGAATFPISLTDAAGTGRIAAEVTALAYGSSSLPRDAITAAVNRGRRQLTVTVTAAEVFARAGDYRASLRLTGSGNEQFVSVTLTRQAAVLSGGSAVEVVEYVGWFAEWTPSRRPVPQLPVGDAGPLLTLSALQLERAAGTVAVGRCDGQGRPIGEAVMAVGVPAGGVLTLCYATAGFELGSATRTMELRSPQLAAPVTVAFSVSTRYSPLLIPVIALAGILAGLVVRGLLTWLVTWSQRRRARSDLLVAIARARLAYTDRELEQVLGSAKRSVDSTKVSNEVIGQQLGIVEAALEAAQTRRQEHRKKLTQFGRLGERTWLLPPSLTPGLHDLSRQLTDAFGAVEAYDNDRAEMVLAAAERAGAALLESLSDWSARYGEAVASMLAALPADSPDAGLTDLRRALDQAKAEATAPQDLTAGLELVDRLLRGWDARVEPAARDVLAGYRDREPDLAAAVAIALTQPDPIDKVRQATRPLTRLVRKPAPSGDGDGVVPESAVEAAPVQTTVQEVQLAIPARDLDRKELAAVDPDRSFVLVIGAAALIVRTVVLAVIACGVAYLVAASTWVGTPDQILAVLAWAFALDMTVEAVSGLLGPDAKLPKLAGAADDGK